MAQYDCADARAPQADDAEALYELGIVHASGRSAPVDLVSAHKWFKGPIVQGSEDELARIEERVGERTGPPLTTPAA